MSDYNLTRSVAEELVTRYAAMLKQFEEDYEEEVVVSTLVKYYRYCSKEKEPDEDLLWAIERVLQDYMTSAQYTEWKHGNG